MSEEKGIRSMGEILHIAHASIREMFEDVVEVTEKVDGSFFSFCMLPSGELVMRSKGQQLFEGAPSSKMFNQAMEVVKLRADSLTPGWIYRGEYLMKPKHNSLAYDRVPLNNVAIFDIEIDMGTHLNAVDRNLEAHRLGFSFVPVLYQGYLSDPAAVQQFLGAESFLGGQNIEGVVVKSATHFLHGHMMMGKLVDEKFKEKHSTEWKNANPGKKDVIESIIDIYKHENRWKKAIQHLRDEGLLDGSPKDIGPLMKEISADVLKEEEAAIKESLWKYAWPQISRGVTRGFPDWYKQQLLEENDSI